MFVDKLKVILEDLKGIKRLEFDAPTKEGVYVLTGVNGCGKTTLLTALARLSNSNVFTQHLAATPFDDYSKSTISYHIEKGGEHKNCSIKRTAKMWVPSPKNFSLGKESPFVGVTYISTARQRFVESSIKDHPIEKTEAKSRLASERIRKGMMKILYNPVFDRLRFQTIKNKGAGARNPSRGNKVYYVPLEDGRSFSEINFSFGERMVLNTLEVLENLKEKSLLLIDEIELALHPTAQIRFYEYLSAKAKELHLMVILSTHSPSLIRKATNRIYLDRDGDGVITAKYDCYPAYILRDISYAEDTYHDFLFFVEDRQAERLLRSVLEAMRKKEDFARNTLYRICPVAGWEETVKLMEEFKSIPPYSPSKVEAFPDHDATETLNEYRAKQPDALTDAEKRRLALWDRCKENIISLHITPELGVWNWVKDSHDAQKAFQMAIESKYGNQVFRLSDIVDSLIGGNVAGKNEREKAKHRLMDLHAELVKHIPAFPEDEFYRMLYDVYVTENYAKIKNYYKQSICQIIHRK